ncbi:MAG: hypothetical protein SGILL_010456, partial [Bacillariaceae sp.]
MGFKIASDNIAKWWYASKAMDTASDFNGCDFLIMETGPFAEFDTQHWKTEYLVKKFFCKFDFDFDLRSFIESLKDGGLKPEIMSDETLIANAQFIGDINDKISDRRSAVTPSEKQDLVFKGKKGEDIILVYPFTKDDSVLQEAATGLPDFLVEPSDNIAIAAASKKNSTALSTNRQRSHAVTIRVQDYGRLQPLTWLNDSLVDFYMLWISRGMENLQESDVHFFTSHFFTTLSKNGPAAVTSWTSKKNIDIFKKKLIFIPINKTMHWSLCVVVNPGEIENYEP